MDLVKGTLVAVAVAAAITSACRYDPSFGSCTVLCTTDTSCPTGSSCRGDHFCHRNDAPLSEMCPDGVAPDGSPAAADSTSSADAMPVIWDGTYVASITYVNPPTGCDFFPRVVISGVDADGYGAAGWYGGGTSTADIYFPDAQPNEIRFGLFTASDDVIYPEWIGTRDASGAITTSGALGPTSDSCYYGLELTRE